MKIMFNSINFEQKSSLLNENKNKTIHYFDENNKLVRTIETDRFGRDTDTKQFKKGKLISHMHKFYNGDNFVEMYKDKSQQYTRKVDFKIINGLQHRTEEYISKTSPDSNYFQEFVRDVSGKLIKVISNGKVILNLK